MTHALRRCAVLLAVTLWLAAPPALAAPKAELWERWTAHQAGSAQDVDHGPWTAFLSRHVAVAADGVARLPYGAIPAADKAALKAYLATLAATPVDSLDRPAQFAFWVNLYNALTVDVVLDHYPVDSIRDIDISPGFFSNGPWGKKLITVAGEQLSLDDIEHRILRPIWRDPRIHYAVNCASIGCPNLLTEAFTVANTEAMLDAAARAYINHPRGASVVDGRLVVSRIYDWFREDFGDSEAGVIAHLRQYAAADLQAKLAGIADIRDHAYDWGLNDLRQ